MAEEASDAPKTAKEQFRAALDRKKAAARRSENGARNDGSVHGTEVTGGGRRSFRRKTG